MMPAAVSAAGEPDVRSQGLLAEDEFALAVRLIHDYAGIRVGPQKRQMVHNRLARRLKALRLQDFSAYLAHVQQDAAEREAFVNALTTNLTAFFREPHHFDLLHQHAQLHRQRHAHPLRLWSAGCATGEEAWSAAMVLREAGCAAEVLATDIDTQALQAAAAGEYPLDRLEAVSPQRLRAHWLRGTGEYAGRASARQELRALVRFLPLNLQASPWPPMEPWDAIFCRNVVIYFDREAQMRLVARFAQLLRPGGLLMVGHAESFPAAHPAFRACGRTAYQRVSTGGTG
jgi:chemotaxis protein methyltransferase CheR